MSRHVSCSMDSPAVLFDLAQLVEAAKQRLLGTLHPVVIGEACLLMLISPHSVPPSPIRAAKSSGSNPTDRTLIYIGSEVVSVRHYKAFWPSSPGLSAQLPPIAALSITPSHKVRDFPLVFTKPASALSALSLPPKFTSCFWTVQACHHAYTHICFEAPHFMQMLQIAFLLQRPACIPWATFHG